MAKWTEKHDSYLRDNYGKKTASEIGVHLKRSRGSVENRLQKIGLRLDETTRQERWYSGMFKVGSVPFNKGKKASEYLSAETIEKIKKTSFKTGSIPHNTRNDGAITIRADSSGRNYKYIRTAKNRWELFHRIVYAKTHGPIPNDMIVKFIDGDTMNCEIDNLKLISKSENMELNTIHRYPPEIITTIKLVGKLNKLITKKQNHGKK